MKHCQNNIEKVYRDTSTKMFDVFDQLPRPEAENKYYELSRQLKWNVLMFYITNLPLFSKNHSSD